MHCHPEIVKPLSEIRTTERGAEWLLASIERLDGEALS